LRHERTSGEHRLGRWRGAVIYDRTPLAILPWCQHGCPPSHAELGHQRGRAWSRRDRSADRQPGAL